MNNTIKFFKKICKIPRPSGSEEKIRDYLVNFAKTRNLDYYTDNSFNVVIKKPSSTPKKKDKSIILQAHTDMVCEKILGKEINFLTDPIDIIEENDFIKANGTTLGADNGIGLSMILSLLDSTNPNFPNLECVFTTQEETTMQGAKNLDCSFLKSKHLLSLDGTDEGNIECSCAGMIVLNASKVFNLEDLQQNNKIYKVKLTGFMGGHSGTEINSTKQNAIIHLFKFLKNIPDVKLINIEGGGKSNAIPRDIFAVFSCNSNIKCLIEQANIFAQKLANFEPNTKLEVSEESFKNYQKSLNKLQSKTIIDFISSYKNGVLFYSELEKNFPITSNNFANIVLENGKLNIVVSLRSSSKEKEKYYLNEIMENAKNFGIKFEIVSTAPFFERKENSYLQKLCVNEYFKLFNKKAVVKDVHAGLEGGVFAKKIPDIDICVIAPNLYNIHSPDEKVSVSSVNRVYSWVEKILESF